ncbi:lysine biosynthesis protein LysX [Candidatus Gottesmanbacteria bacterium]|nr:lysine biosynthesis protein LysX [Candidatus Gottesmanbacteria bacterium]
MTKKTIGLLHTTIRGDEKLIIEAARKEDVSLEVIDIRESTFSLGAKNYKFEVALERCVSTVKGMHALEYFGNINIPTVNALSVARICENKFLTSLNLGKQGVPTPRFCLVFSETQAKEAVAKLGGFPIVLKPVSGSWGRLLSKVNDMDALESILEQKTTLGGPQHHAFYLQEYINKPGRDIRLNVVGKKAVAAIYRESNHWITNTARGAEPINCPITKDLEDIAEKTVGVIGEGVLGIDIFESKDGLLVNEVNHTMEFKNVQRITGIDIAREIIKYSVSKIKS